MNILFYQYFQIAAVLSGIVFFNSLIREKMVGFFVLCLIGLISDLFLVWVIENGFKNNYFIINLYSVVTAPVIFYSFYIHLKLSKRSKVLYKICALIISLGFVADYIFGKGTVEISTITILFYFFFNILLCCGLLFKMAMRDEVFSFSNEPIFWISAGLLIFSLGALVVLGMNQYIRINHLTIKNRALYRVIMPILNVILYSSFTYAFILCRLKKKSYLL